MGLGSPSHSRTAGRSSMRWGGATAPPGFKRRLAARSFRRGPSPFATQGPATLWSLSISRHCERRDGLVTGTRARVSRAEARAPFLNAGGRKPPLNRSGAASSASFIEDDLRPPDVKERPGALAAAFTTRSRDDPRLCTRARWVATDDGPWLALTFADRRAFIHAMGRSYRSARL